MLKQFLTLWVIVVFSVGYTQEAMLQSEKPAASEKNEATANINSENSEGKVEQPKEKPRQKEEEEQSPGQISLVEEFYKDPGLELFPRTRTFSLINTLRNEIYYDSNVYLTPEKEIDDVVYGLDFSSKLDAKWKRLELEATGGIRYEHYFDEDRLDSFLPYAIVDLQYREEIFYIKSNLAVYRHGVVNTLEFNDHSTWVQISPGAEIGLRYKRWLVEANYSYNNIDYRKISGDAQQHRVAFRVGYQMTQRLYLIGMYHFNYIDYQDALWRDQRQGIDPNLIVRQKDTTGHGGELGMEFQFTRTLNGRISVGFEYHDYEWFWSFRGNVAWRPLPSLTVDLEVLRTIQPSLFGDYKLWTSESITFQYLLATDLALSTKFTVSHSNPETGSTSTGFFNHTKITYRIVEGVSMDVFYRGAFVDSGQAAREYERHIAGAGLEVVF